jgi:hypothetical protein
MHQSHMSKLHTKPPTPWHQLSPKPTTSPPRKKVHTYQQVWIMEGKDEELKVDITTQYDDKLMCI